MDVGALIGGETTPNGFLPLTAAQRGMWFAENLTAHYSITIAHYIDIRDKDREIDRELLKRCIRDAAWEFESPFTRISEVGGVPIQIVDRTVNFEVDELDFRGQCDAEARALEWMRAEYARSIDLTAGPLATACLLRIADDRTILYMGGHHIVLDGYSALTSLMTALNLYNARLGGTHETEPARAGLAEIVDYDQTYASSTRRERDREYWAEKVRDLPERVTLSAQSATAPLSAHNVVAGYDVDAETQGLVESVASGLNSSAAVVLTAAFSAFLARMTGTDEVVLSLPVTGRATAKVRNGGGMLSNMLPVRARSVSDATMRELIAQMQLELTGALRHQRFRFEDIRLEAGLADTVYASFGPIVNMMFFDKPVTVTGATVGYHILSSGILEDLRCNLYQASPGAPLTVDLHGNPNLYTERELDRHVRRFIAFTRALLSDLESPIERVELLLPEERGDLLALGAGEPMEIDADGSVLGPFDAQCRATPDATAIEFDGQTWTYHEFSQMRSDLALRLRADGVGVGDTVVVSLERGVDQVCAVYAALTLGAAYVPVDPQAPAARRTQITDTVGAAVVVDDAYLERGGAQRGHDADSEPRSLAGPAAYVIFTSGSTGAPKGVEVGHRAVINRLEWMQKHYPLGVDDRVLYKTPITFDVSVWELLWPLRTGARLVIAQPGGHRDPDYLHSLMEERAVTVAHFVPSMLDVFSEVLESKAVSAMFPASMRRVFTSGEALAAELAATVRSRTAVDLVNLYGPTEAAVDVTEYRVDSNVADVPIGRPVPNVSVYVLDSQLRPVPVNATGELYLAGDQLAIGYTGQPGLTADRFVANPYDGGTRMYRTGDLVRWSAAGEILYIGRADFQVKIRGQRVELGEIESVMAELPGVDKAVVIARSDNGRTAVVGYVRRSRDAGDVTAEGGTTEDNDVTADALLGWCRRRLPSHMVPSAVVFVDEFPVGPNGKLDRTALAPPSAQPEEQHVPARTDDEIGLARVIGELLDVPRVGMRDNLFRLGADSLSAARLTARVRSELGRELRVLDIFGSDDIGQMAKHLTDIDESASGPRPMPRPDALPLSSAQTRLWFINRLDPSAGTYNMAGTVSLIDVDIDAMRSAVVDVVARHEPLRTVFTAVDGEPIQVIRSVDDLPADVLHGVEHVSPADLDARVLQEASRGFDLTSETPLRVRIFLSDGTATVLVVLHHVAGDGASLTPLIRDLTAAYVARRSDTEPTWAPLPLQYADYALWQRERLGDRHDANSLVTHELEFWRNHLAGLPELLDLPTDRPRPRIASGAGDFVDVSLGEIRTRRILELADSRGVTPFMVVHTALSIVLSRLAGVDDVPIGVAVAGRADKVLDDVVGMFVNTVLVRVRPLSRLSVSALIGEVRGEFAAVLARSETPFDVVIDELAPHRSLSHTPIYQVGVTWQHGHPAMAVDDAPVQVRAVRVPAAKSDLSVSFVQSTRDGAQHIDAEFSYATDIFERESVQRLTGFLFEVLDGMLADPTRSVGSLDIVDAGNRDTVPRPAPVDPQTFAAIIEAGTARGLPTALAMDGEYRTRYADLIARTNQFSRELIARGVGPGDIVAISIPRSPDSVMATLAVIKSGAGFVLLDPGQPAARRATMLADSGARVGIRLTADGRRSAPDAEINEAAVSWIEMDDPDTEIQIAGHGAGPIVDAERTRPIDLSDVAYLIFTSGSTGTPKATAVSHLGLAGFAHNLVESFGVDRNSRVLHVSSPSFDASILELLLAFSAGAQLVVAASDTYAGEQLSDFIERHEVTHALLTPSVLATLDPHRAVSLSTILSGGEALSAELLGRWSQRRVFNLYGPTECTVWATLAGPLRADAEVTIGTALPGVTARVLDSALRPVPDGVAGELYLAGDQVALGYRGRPGLTVTRFVADPFGHGRRYRTGDRVTRRPTGELVYHGRSDFQLKIRGLRIEPGEVDAALAAHPEIDAALSIGVTGPAGEAVLVTYVTAHKGVEPQPEGLLAFAREQLPAYMVPQTVVILNEWPLTRVGKVDRKSLPAVDFTMSADFVAPRSQLEDVIAGLFAEALGLDRVSVHDGFFELGGNSLAAAKLAARLSTVLDRQVSVRELFEASTASELATHVANSFGGSSVPRLIPHQRAEMVPVSTVQRGMWLLNRADPDSAAYNVSMALRLEGDLDIEALTASVQDVIRRHESLRTTYPMVNGRPVQVIIPADDAADRIDMQVVDVSDDIASAIAEVNAVGFDVTEQPPIRLKLLRVSNTGHVLSFVVHHISADGASMAPLARDLMEAYAARSGGHAPHWRPLSIQYADFALWQAEKLAHTSDGVTEEERQLSYWSERLASVPDLLELPTDRDRSRSPSFAGGAVEFEIAPDVVAALESIARSNNTTLFMVMHAAYVVFLSRVSGVEDIVVGTPYAGRGEQALERVVGMFVNTLPLRTSVRPGEQFTELLARVRHEDLSDFSHTDVAFDAIVARVLRHPPVSYNPLFQVMFAFQNFEFPVVELPGVRATPLGEPDVSAKVDLQLTLTPTGGAGNSIDGQITYARDLFDESTVARMAARFALVLDAVVADSSSIVGDIDIRLEDELQRSPVETVSAHDVPLADLVRIAAGETPAAIAIDFSGVSLTFADIEASMTAMAVVMPDAGDDSALTMALMTSVPPMAAGGPEALDEVLKALRDNATQSVTTEEAHRP